MAPPWWFWNGCGPLILITPTGLLVKTLPTSYGQPQNGQIRKFSFARELCKKFANFRAFCTRVANKKLRISRRFSVYHVTSAAANRKPALVMLARGPDTACSAGCPDQHTKHHNKVLKISKQNLSRALSWSRSLTSGEARGSYWVTKDNSWSRVRCWKTWKSVS